MPVPSVTIVIVNYNGKDLIKKCLRSIMDTDYDTFDVIVIDNSSTDGSLEILEDEAKRNTRLTIIRNKINVGDFYARNIGILNASSKYVAFLDNDTEVDPLWLKEMVKTMEADKLVSVTQSKLLLADRRELDSCGHFLTLFGFVYEAGVGEVDEGQYDSVREIFGAKNAAMIIDREIINTIGLFGEDYFMAWGETDLCWRVWLAGYKVCFAPKSVVYHLRGGSVPVTPFSTRLYQGTKNGLRTLIKNLGFKNLLLMLPLCVASNLLLAAYFILQKKIECSEAIIEGVLWNLKCIRKTLQERSYVQRYVRKVKDDELEPFMIHSKSFIFFYTKGKAWLSRMKW